MQNIIDPNDGHIKCVVFTKTAACGYTIGVTLDDLYRMQLPDKIDFACEYEDLSNDQIAPVFNLQPL